MTEQVSLPRTAKGDRPHFFENESIDHLVTMVLELSAELYTVYARVDSLERHLEKKGIVDSKELDAFRPDKRAEEERLAWRELFLDRLLRTIKADQG